MSCLAPRCSDLSLQDVASVVEYFPYYIRWLKDSDDGFIHDWCNFTPSHVLALSGTSTLAVQLPSRIKKEATVPLWFFHVCKKIRDIEGHDINGQGMKYDISVLMSRILLELDQDAAFIECVRDMGLAWNIELGK